MTVHFIGPVVYVEEGLNTVASQSPLLVVDGQRRLTTAMLLIEALARRVGTGEPVDGFSARKPREYYTRGPAPKRCALLRAASLGQRPDDADGAASGVLVAAFPTRLEPSPAATGGVAPIGAGRAIARRAGLFPSRGGAGDRGGRGPRAVGRRPAIRGRMRALGSAARPEIPGRAWAKFQNTVLSRGPSRILPSKRATTPLRIGVPGARQRRVIRHQRRIAGRSRCPRRSSRARPGARPTTEGRGPPDALRSGCPGRPPGVRGWRRRPRRAPEPPARRRKVMHGIQRPARIGTCLDQDRSARAAGPAPSMGRFPQPPAPRAVADHRPIGTDNRAGPPLRRAMLGPQMRNGLRSVSQLVVRTGPRQAKQAVVQPARAYPRRAPRIGAGCRGRRGRGRLSKVCARRRKPLAAPALSLLLFHASEPGS